MAGSLDFPFGTGVAASALPAGVQVKLDNSVDPYEGISLANPGDHVIGVTAYESNSNPTSSANTYVTPIKLFYPTFLGNITGGNVTRGTALYNATGGLFTPVSGGALIGLAGQSGNIGDEIQIFVPID